MPQPLTCHGLTVRWREDRYLNRGTVTIANIYETSSIAQVILRADFDQPRDDLTKIVTSQVVPALAAGFPGIEEKDARTQQVTLTVQNRSQNVSQVVSDPFKVWTLISVDGATRLEICRDYLLMMTSKYVRFSLFLDPFQQVIELLKDAPTEDELVFRRLGLRYINHVTNGDGAPDQWDGFISPDLINSLRFVDPNRLMRCMSTIEADHGDTVVRLQYGLPNPSYPEPVSRGPFVIDIDAYKATQIAGPDLADEVERLNRLAYVYFEKAIGPEQRNVMKVAEEIRAND